MKSQAQHPAQAPRRLAVVGAGISGLSCAWLLAKKHHVTLFEAGSYFGGHTNTVNLEVTDDKGQRAPLAVDTGFIVFNDRNYPNLQALFRELDVPWQHSNMTFSVSVRDGALEYAGNGLTNIFAQPGNALRPAFWRLLKSIARFYKATGELDTRTLPDELTLGEYLDEHGYPAAFVDEHLLPMVAAIWSCPTSTARGYPMRSFLKFAQNHGLVSFGNRPQWLTVTGGAKRYVEKILKSIPAQHAGTPVVAVERFQDRVELSLADGHRAAFDGVVLACHADEALKLLASPTAAERELLGVFRYTDNQAYLHSDPALMPKRPRAWAAWNYLERSGASRDKTLFCSYWMNRLQSLETRDPLIVTLNPPTPPKAELIHRTRSYTHPIFDAAVQKAQQSLWTLQGVQRTWFCGAYFGAGFHEDGIQAGLSAAEQVGGVLRPWHLDNPSDRIILGPTSDAA